MHVLDELANSQTAYRKLHIVSACFPLNLEAAYAAAYAKGTRETAAKDAAINRVVREVYMKTKEQKLRIEAKAMPKDHPVPETPAATSTPSQPVKGPPAIVLEQRAKEATIQLHSVGSVAFQGAGRRKFAANARTH